jgi:integrase
MPSVKHFTDVWLKAQQKKRPSRRIAYSEESRKGFVVLHQPGGTLAFNLRYQLNGAPQWLKLGEYPTLSLEQAGEEYSQARKSLRLGLDPKVERERQKLEHEREEQRQRVAGAVGIRNIIAEWAWHHARRHRKHPREAVRLLKKYVALPLKGKPAAEIRKRDIVLLLDRITARGSLVMANRVDALGKQVFSFAVSRDLLESSPWIGINRPGGEEKAKERKLSDTELRSFWHGLDTAAISEAVRLALKLVLVTAQRPGEVAGAALSEFNDKLWTIPADRSKNEKQHQVPLSPLAIGLIDRLMIVTAPKKGRPRSAFLLPSVHVVEKPDEPISVRALSRALRNSIDDEGKLFGCTQFTPHDLRRSAASRMTALGIDRLHVSKVLNHQDDGVTGRVYDQHDYFPEKSRALTTWANHIDKVVTEKTATVVHLPATSRAA